VGKDSLPGPAVFLDRDGTLIREREYLADPEGVVLIPGVPESLRALHAAGFVLVVVTNQSGIARSLYSQEDYLAVETRLDEVLGEEGAFLHGSYFCPHHPDFTGPCVCRKPASGMHREAAGDLNIDLSRSVFIGDRLKDILPATEFGGKGILVRTGYGKEEEQGLPQGYVVVNDLPEAAQWILGEKVP
jgi:D-glycero-D-manno-heptose 1,7-bisphosphate phosphatase